MKTLKPTNIIHHITKLKDKKKIRESIWCCSLIYRSKSISPEHGQTLRDCDWRKLSLPFPAICSSFTFGSRSSSMEISFSLNYNELLICMKHIHKNFGYYTMCFVHFNNANVCDHHQHWHFLFWSWISDGVGHPSVFVLILLINE